MKDTFKLIGEGYFERRRKDGSVIDSWTSKNTVVTMGKVAVAKLLNNVSSNYFDSIAIGDDDTPPAIGQEALVSEVKRGIASLSYSATAKAVFEKTFDFVSGESYSIVEAGIFNSESAGGDMLDRLTFSAKAVDVDTDLFARITITVT